MDKQAVRREASSPDFVPPCPAWLAKALAKSQRRINVCWSGLLFLQNLAARIDKFKGRCLRCLHYGWMLNHGWDRSVESSAIIPGNSSALKEDIHSQGAQSK